MASVPSVAFISSQEFSERRQRLLDAMENNSVAVIPAATEATRSRDTEYPFRQDSDFFYLTGFNEPDAMLLLVKSESQTSVLFCREKDRMAEIWQGRRLGPELAVAKLGVDQAESVSELPEKLRELLNGKRAVYFAQGAYASVDKLVFDVLQQLRSAPKKGWRAPTQVHDLRTIIHEMRLFKSDSELAAMRRAAEISAEAHCRAMRFTGGDKTEYQVEAELHHAFALEGARFPAYGSIVGGGDNACILHYTENADPLNEGDLLLIDAGCELQGYAADITRTFPVSGKFNKVQAKLYQLVLDSQLAALELVQPGKTLKQAGDAAIRVITAGLKDLGILEGEVDTLIKDEAYKAYFMHGIGHWLGLDVHDVGEYKIDGVERPFEPGMVLTIEPGLYIDDQADVDDQFKGIGIRIEDNVVITDSGHEIITGDVPKTIAEIESLMAGA